MERPRIVILGPAHPFRGGIAHFSNRMAKALRAHADVKLVTFTRQYPNLLFPGQTQFEDSPWTDGEAPLRLLDSVNPLSWAKTGREIARMRPSAVILVHWLPFFVPAYLGVMRAMHAELRKTGGTPPLITGFQHNVYPHKKFPATKPLMQRFLATCDRFVTLSPHIAADLRGMVPDANTLETFHPTYDHYSPALPKDEAREKLGIPPDQRTLLFFGYIRPYKGLDVLLNAMPEIYARTGAKLLVAGEFYDNEAEMRAQVKQLGLDQPEDAPIVRFYSQYIPNEEVHLYFSAADALVQPYRRATPSGVAQTAYFFGKPMVTTNLGVFAEVVPDGIAGVLVPPEDPAALAGGIEKFYALGADALAEGAKAQVARFSWDTFASTFAPFVIGESK